jgi:hypothetical protein
MLPGWERSTGATAEYYFARWIGLEILDARTFKPLAEESILEEALRITRGDRQDDYGHPFDEHGVIADFWTTHLGFKVTAEQVAECMILMKMARNRHRRKRDNHTDMAGYADCLHRIVEERARRAAA